jgi:hypothetical protein
LTDRLTIRCRLRNENVESSPDFHTGRAAARD